MPYVKIDRSDITSISELARMVGKLPETVWAWIKLGHDLEQPDVRRGHRDYYSRDALARVRKQLEAKIKAKTGGR